MKVGIRKPSIKKSFKARTTGRIKRSIKRTVNPFYGKKGMGYIRNPKKAVYNKIYRKTSVSAWKFAGSFGYIIMWICLFPIMMLIWIIKKCGKNAKSSMVTARRKSAGPSQPRYAASEKMSSDQQINPAFETTIPVRERKKVCVYCDTVNGVESERCIGCDATEFKHICAYCGTLISGIYCGNCGRKINE